MARIAAEQIQVRPTNNIYTVLAIVAVVLQIAALVALILRHGTLFGTNLWS